MGEAAAVRNCVSLLFSRQHPILFCSLLYNPSARHSGVRCAHLVSDDADIRMENFLELLFIGNKQRSAAYFSSPSALSCPFSLSACRVCSEESIK